MSLRVQIDTVKYRNDLNQFVTRLNADSSLLLKEEMRLLLRDIQRLTPPKTLAQGRKAVSGDMRRVAAPLDPDKIKFPAMAKAVRDRDGKAIQAIADNLKSGFFAKRHMILNDGDLRSAHIAARNNRGRVKRDQNNMTFLRTWRKYTAEIQNRVGYARAGWAAAAAGVGLKLPSWVSRHAGYSKGGYKAPSPNDLEIIGTNRASKLPNYQATVDAAMRIRVKSIGLELKRLLDGGKSRRASLAGTTYGEASE
jgi:hypothetical protein